MPTLTVPTLAGLASTVIFAVSTLPMLAKAYRSRDLSSYSLGNIGLANVGNVVHSVYVFSLPPGPIWALHSFYLVSRCGRSLGHLRRQRLLLDDRGLPGDSRLRTGGALDHRAHLVLR